MVNASHVLGTSKAETGPTATFTRMVTKFENAFSFFLILLSSDLLLAFPKLSHSIPPVALLDHYGFKELAQGHTT